ncbi:MAG: hypothetical protein JSV10_03695 [Candidatus Zixiibacteriota bacterium]|nr:MAG: hypothetical protein JSV10_03695 [candidate division Zixibacteria bacterium]
MDLRKATLLAIIAICYTFTLRAAWTFFPDFFRILTVAQVAQITALLAGLAMVLFFVSLLAKYVEKDQTGLRRATVLALAGSAAMLLVRVKGLLLVVFDAWVSPELLWFLQTSRFLGAVVPWASSILILLFFVAFYKETLRDDKMKLRGASLLAVIGSLVGTLMLTFVLFNYLYFRELMFFVDLPRMLAIMLSPLFAFSFIAVLYFFSSFYKQQRQMG